MRKHSLVATIALLFAVTALLGSGSMTTAAAASKQRIPLLTAASTGTWYIVGSGMAQVINKYVPGVQVTVETGGGAMNAMRIGKKEAILGMTMCDNAHFAYYGGREYTEAYKDLRVVLSGHASPMKIIARAGSGIKTFNDLRGKRVALGYSGSAQAVTAVAICETLGLKPGKDFDVRWLTPEEGAGALKDGVIDATFAYPADPSGSIIELANSIDIVFVQYDVDKVVAKHPYWFKQVLKAGTYRGQNQDYYGVSGVVLLVTHKDADPELIYQITKALLEHPDELGQVHPAAKEWTIENITRGVTIPYHTGTERYLREKGVLK